MSRRKRYVDPKLEPLLASDCGSSASVSVELLKKTSQRSEDMLSISPGSKEISSEVFPLTGPKESSAGSSSPVVVVTTQHSSRLSAPMFKHHSSTSAELKIPTKESQWEIVIDNADPGLEFVAMLNNKNACINKVDWSKSPADVKEGMRLVMIDNLNVLGLPYQIIMEHYHSAIRSLSEPTTLVLAEDPATALHTSADVAHALVWKEKMESENYNDSLHVRAREFIDGLRFQIFMMLIIFFDFIMILFDSQNIYQFSPTWVRVFSWIILGIYIFEISVRIYSYRPRIFFRRWFCVFDFSVVILCVFAAVLQDIVLVEQFRSRELSMIRVVRILRPITRLLTECWTKLPQAVRYRVRMNKMAFRDGEFNLDLCYITRRIISMSLPSVGLEGNFRNPIADVVSFFDVKHPSHYMIYDLCLERSYETSLFHDRVQHFKFPDHSVPTIAMMLRFCNSVQKWMAQSQQNVIAVHCKGGKGRTGTMVCAWLLYRYRESTADEVIDYFAKMRTNHSIGTKSQGIGSQVRYVNYFYDYLHLHNGNIDIFKSPFGFQIHEIGIGPFYNCDLGVISVEIFERPEEIIRGKGRSCQSQTIKFGNGKPVMLSGVFAHVKLNIPHKNKSTLFRGNIRIGIFSEVNNERKMLMSFWLNTFLTKSPRRGEMLRFDKLDIDKAQKDVEHKNFPEDFAVYLKLRNTNISGTLYSSKKAPIKRKM